jgi:uncharacterized membrane protein
MGTNPYAAPRSHVADVPLAADGGRFIAQGQGVASGRGWSWITDAWALNRLQHATWIGIFLVFAMIVVALSAIPFLGSLLLALLTPVFYGGLMLGCDAQRRGERLEVGHLFAGFRQNTSKLVAIGAFTLVVFIGIFLLIAALFGFSMMSMMMGGAQPTAEQMQSGLAGMALALLILMGLSVPVYMAVWFSTPLVMLNQLDTGAALKSSFAACLKNVMPFLVWGAAMFLLAIAASLPIMLGWLLLGPVLLASVYTGYRDIYYAH